MELIYELSANINIESACRLATYKGIASSIVKSQAIQLSVTWIGALT